MSISTDTSTARPPAVLRALIGGAVHVPGEPGYDAARACFNVTVDQRPAAIVEPRSAEEVAAIVKFARAEGLRLAPQRTGHNAAPLGPLEGSILLKTNALDRVCIDAPTRRARVGAGCRWEDVVAPASELGLACLHGSTPDVSVVGYTLGGGMGWYARKHGLAANHVVAIEVVTADGQIRWATHEHDPELFWALRGGGGNFGVVTAIEFELLPLEKVYAGALFFPVERASEVLHAWHAWTADAPEDVTSVGRILQFPPLEIVPEPVRGKSFVLVEAVFLGDAEAAARMMEPLRALGPAMDTFASVPPAAIAELHMDPRDPVPYDSTHAILGALDAAAIDRLVEAAGPGSGSALLSVELRQAGGALGRAVPGAGAVATLPGEFAFFAVGGADPTMAAKTSADLDRVGSALRPYEAGRYFNFVEEEADAAEFFPPTVARRLEAARDTYDPTRLMQANHEIGAAR
ncbi:MAG: 6-hydroxynicotine oxidase [Solirubrobacterales bacterium 70-9]|nr:MAG: 6-hydroxynicotine oxidase [Solirubrobacterales bacterium 70-9]